MQHSNGTVSTSNGFSGCRSYEGGGERINKFIENSESTLAEYVVMIDQLVKDLAIEEAFQDEIKYTLEHNNQSYVDWGALSYKGQIKIRLNLPLHMI